MARTGGENNPIIMTGNGPRIKLNDTAGNSFLEIVDADDFPMHRFDSRGNDKHRGRRDVLNVP